MDVNVCGGGDPNQGYRNTAVPLSSSAIQMVKAAILMGDPLFHWGLPYEVGTCRAGGVRSSPASHTIFGIIRLICSSVRRPPIRIQLRARR